MPKTTTSADFWDKADKTGECWIWTGHIDKHGYGRQGASYAHRYAYELHTLKSIPEGHQIDHMCHERACVRPDHLRAVTNKQNGENRRGRTATAQAGSVASPGTSATRSGAPSSGTTGSTSTLGCLTVSRMPRRPSLPSGTRSSPATR